MPWFSILNDHECCSIRELWETSMPEGKFNSIQLENTNRGNIFNWLPALHFHSICKAKQAWLSKGRCGRSSDQNDWRSWHLLTMERCDWLILLHSPFQLELISISNLILHVQFSRLWKQEMLRPKITLYQCFPGWIWICMTSGSCQQESNHTKHDTTMSQYFLLACSIPPCPYL